MIRFFARADADAAVELLRRTAVDWTSSARSLVHKLTSHPERARQAAWVAEEDGRLVGWCRALLRWEVGSVSVGTFWIGVDPPRRGRGLGTELFELAEDHLAAAGAETLESFAAVPEGERFLGGRGFRPAGCEIVSSVDPRQADLAGLSTLEDEQRAQGFELSPLGAVLERARGVHAVYAGTAADVPDAFVADDLRYEDWVRECLEDPDLSPEGSAVVLHEERPVSVAILMVNGEGAAANDMTGTLRAYRRRGLARLAKLATLRWAAENGVTHVLTENAVDNPGMLALNRALGYRPFAEQVGYLRET